MAVAYIAFSCQSEKENKYVEIYYDFAPGALTPMEIYCKCVSLNDTRKKQFQYSFTVKGDSLSGFLKHFKELKPSGSTDTINARAFILFHNSDHTDTLCVGYKDGIKLNGQTMEGNSAFTKEVTTLVVQYHVKMLTEKFAK